MSTLTTEHLNAILPDAPAGDIEEELPYVLRVMKEYEINTKLRFAAFIANVAKESGQLWYTEEIADGWDYEWRSDLGNTQPGDGPFFKGHGYIQITGRNNHRVVGEALGVDAISNPKILEEMPYAWLSAAYYWRYMSAWGDLNFYADAGDFETTVLGVRGAGDPDRRWFYDKAMEVLPDDLKADNGEGDVTTYPEKQIEYEEAGWAKVDGAYLRSEPDLTLNTNKNGWLWKPIEEEEPSQPEPSKECEWPTEELEPDPNSWNYQARHPTRYFWRPDVEAWACHLVKNYDVWCNTYLEHPEGWGFNVASTDEDGTTWYVENTSIDVWGPAGRNDFLDPGIGKEIFDLLFNDLDKPDIDWIIYNAWIWSYHGGWAPWGTDDFTWHYDHIHVTYF